MVEKVYPTASNQATFICPKCKKTKTVDVSEFVGTPQTIRVRAVCSCGHKWTSVLEKRKKYRKKVDLPGTYTFISRDAAPRRDRSSSDMKVTDLSTGGVKLKLNVQRSFQIGDRLNIEFCLDDTKQTLIKKTVVVRNISGLYIGAAFKSTDAYDPVLGFYLMN